MTSELRDPDLPPGAVVEVDKETGEGIRNDGKRLRPAEKNPWYVLATVFGEQTDKFPDVDLHEKNRRIWNGWACAGIDAADRARLARLADLSDDELAPLSESEISVLTAAFRDRLPPETRLPDPADEIECSDLYFSRHLVFENCIFASRAIFKSGTYDRFVIFGNAVFRHDAWFPSATFSDAVSFDRATFKGSAIFRSATFSQRVRLKSATFGGYANFESALFRRAANFGSATFSEFADFSDGAFMARTDFEEARFVSRIPSFYQRDPHQDTLLTTEEAYWPEITEKNAKDGKRAYVRLRQLMNGLHKPDDEHFFFRQEMRCDAVLKKGLDGWIVRLFGWVSDFGFSVTRPLLGLAGVIVICWPIIASHLKYAQGVPGNGSIWQGLGVSFSNTFGFLGFARLMHPEFFVNAPAWLDALSGAQTVAGVVLLFFLGLGLRNRFRLK